MDYWDGLGWPDKFAHPSFTQRQRSQVSRWKNSTLFTPSIVVQGVSNRGSVSFPKVAHTLKASWLSNELNVVGGPVKDATVHIAWLAMNVETDVKRGENAGSKLRHDFIVLKHQILGAHDPAKKWAITQPTNTPASVSALIVWLEVAEVPVVAVGGLL